MGLLNMTNAQMGTPSLGRNGSFVVDYGQKQYPSCGIMYSRRSNLGVGLKTKSEKNIRIFLFRSHRCVTISAMSKEESDKQLVAGGVIQKEFEFKPAFSEYLKAMESVKTDQVRKRAHNSNRYTSEAGSWGKDESKTPSSGRDDENVKVRKFDGYPDNEKMSEAVAQKELQGNDNGVSQYEGVVRRQFDGRGSVIRKSKDKANGHEDRMDAKVKWISRGQVTGHRWLHYQNNVVEPELKDSYLYKDRKFQNSQDSSSVLNNDKKSGSNVNSRGKLVHDRGSSQMFRAKGKSYEKEGVGDRNCETHSGTLVINPIKIRKDTDEEFKRKHKKLIGGSKSFLEEGYDNSWELERAAFNTFEEGNDIMDKRRVSRMEMEERIQRLARRLNGADINVPEWMFSKMMRSAQIRYSDHSILRVIQILGKLGNWRRVLQVIEWLQMRERFKSHRLRCVYTTALNVLGKAKRPVEALNVFHTMQQQRSSYPDLVAYHCITVTLGQAGYLKELFDVIDSMRSLPKKKFKTGTLERWDPRLEPDVVVYNAVLNACIRRKKWEGAFWVLQQLKQEGQKPSATTYGLVMEVMLACGKYNLVHEFFRKVQKSYIPNTLAYKVLVNTLWREGKTDEAVLAVEDMERQGIVGSAALYYDLARCLGSAGRCQEALMQIEKICKVANKPLVVTYTGLIQACLDSGNIRDASYVFNQMKNVCSPNLVTCNIMLKSFMEHGLFEEGMKLFKKMLDDSNHITHEYDSKGLVIPDIYTFNTMLDACISEKRWDDLEQVYRRMLHHGFHFNAKRHVRMILDASKAGKVELLEITWKYLVEADRKPPPSLIKERFCNRLENEDYVTAISCLTSYPVGDSQEFSKAAWLKLFTENSQRFREDTLVQLIQQASSILNAINGSPNVLLLQNLIYSCTEFLRTCTSAPEMKLTETPLYGYETALKC